MKWRRQLQRSRWIPIIILSSSPRPDILGVKLDVPWQSWRREMKKGTKKTKRTTMRTGKNEAELNRKAFIEHGYDQHYLVD